MDALLLIKKYYPENSEIFNVLYDHSRLVADRALLLARNHPELNIDKKFVEEAALLHDIGMFMCDAPDIACHGTEPYILHGVIGAEILRIEGYRKHALVCERHTGSGITKEQIIAEHLPLPLCDMLPISMEEKVICFADKFFSKSRPGEERPLEKIQKSLARYGADSLARFNEMCTLFL